MATLVLDFEEAVASTSAKPAASDACSPNALRASVTISDTVASSSPEAAARDIMPEMPSSIWLVFHPTVLPQGLFIPCFLRFPARSAYIFTLVYALGGEDGSSSLGQPLSARAGDSWGSFRCHDAHPLCVTKTSRSAGPLGVGVRSRLASTDFPRYTPCISAWLARCVKPSPYTRKPLPLQ